MAVFVQMGKQQLSLRFFIVLLFFQLNLSAEEPIFNFILQGQDMHNADTVLTKGDKYYTDCNLNKRKEPSLSSEVVSMLLAGEMVTVLKIGENLTVGSIESKWVQIRSDDGTSGWCFGGYLSSPAKMTPGFFLEVRYLESNARLVYANSNEYNNDIHSVSSLLFHLVNSPVLAVSNDKKILAFRSESSNVLYVYDGVTGILKTVEMKAPDELAISNNGNFIFFSQPGSYPVDDLIVYDLKKQTIRNILKNANGADLDDPAKAGIWQTYEEDTNRFEFGFTFGSSVYNQYFGFYDIAGDYFSMKKIN